MGATQFTYEEKAQLIRRICGLIIQSSVKTACEQCGIKESTFFGWLAADDELSEEYARARKAVSFKNEMEIEALAEMAARGEMPSDVARVAIDAKKWLAGKRNPKVYGDRNVTTVEGSAEKPLQVTHTVELVSQAALEFKRKLEGSE